MHTREYGSVDGTPQPESSSGSLAPGKSTLTSRLSPRVQRHAEPTAVGRDDNGVAAGAEDAVARAASSSGAPLPPALQRRFEGSLGADLSGVRVHTDAASAEAARAVGARAYTVGQDIHFAAGRYAPDDPFGLHLLAHEVAHTAQQARAGTAPAAPQFKLDVSRPDDAAEAEADRAADAMVTGLPTTVSVAAPHVQRGNEDLEVTTKGPFDNGATEWGGEVKGSAKLDPDTTSVGASKGKLFIGKTFPLKLKPFVKEFKVGRVPGFIEIKPIAQIGFEGSAGQDGLALTAAVKVGGSVSGNGGVKDVGSLGVGIELAGEAKETAAVTEAGPVVDTTLSVKGTGKLEAAAGKTHKAEVKIGTWTIGQLKIHWRPDLDGSTFMEDTGLGEVLSALETIAKAVGFLGDVADAAVDLATDMIPGVGIAKRIYAAYGPAPETSPVAEEAVTEAAPPQLPMQSFDTTHAAPEAASPASLEAQEQGTKAQAALDRAIAAAKNANVSTGRWAPAATSKYEAGYNLIAQARDAVAKVKAMVAGMAQRVGGPEPAEVMAASREAIALCDRAIEAFTAGDRAQGVGEHGSGDTFMFTGVPI